MTAASLREMSERGCGHTGRGQREIEERCEAKEGSRSR